MKIGVVGYGVVGRHMGMDLLSAGHEIATYDKVRDQGYPGEEDARKDEINRCPAAFVCVPTPASPDGSVDLSAIEDVFTWLDVDVAIIRSTIPPGTTYALQEQFRVTGMSIAFSPEFIGEGVNAPYNKMAQPPFMIIGGEEPARWKAAAVYQKMYNSECEFIFMEGLEAEICKYAENYFLALKVTWANEMYDICAELGADHHVVMNAIGHDYRIGRSHMHVYEDSRGWGGKCLPKDTVGLLTAVGDNLLDSREGVAPLLKSLILINAMHRLKSLKE